jgi:hypothetical protein
MGIHLPDEVRAALRDGGIGKDEMLLMTGDELREVIGDRLTYELASALAGQRRMFAYWPGREGRLPGVEYRERNLGILRLWLVERMNYTAIGREVGLSNTRVPQILRSYFGVRRGK